MWSLSDETWRLLRELQGLDGWTRRLLSRRTDREAADLLRRIGERGEPGVVPVLARHLLAPAEEVRLAAARGLRELLSRVSADDLIRLANNDAGWLWEVSEAWDKLRPEDAGRVAGAPVSRTSVLGLLSFHRSGYVRHEVVRLLAKVRSGEELPFLLLREQDWVWPVRAEAEAAVRDRLSADYAPHFTANLPLVLRLPRLGRRDSSGVTRWAVAMLTRPEFDLALTAAMRSADREVRRGIVRFALDLGDASSRGGGGPDMAGTEVPGREARCRILLRGLRSEDTVVRLWCVKRLRGCLAGGPLRETLAGLRRDPSMPVRRQAMLLEAESDPATERDVWRGALLDPAPAVRELARVRLRNLGEPDVAGFYRDALRRDTGSLPALAGLAESGDGSDLPVLRGYLSHPVPSRRAAAVRGLARLGGGDAVGELIECLCDASPKVAREAAARLRERLAHVDLGLLYDVAVNGPWGHSRRFALRLIFEAGKWRSLPWLIRGCLHADRETAELAGELFEAWLSPPHCNRVFTKPSAPERAAIERAIGELPESMAGLFRERLGDVLTPG